MKYSEEQIKNYSAGLSETEQQKCYNSISMVRDALRDIGYKNKSAEINMNDYTDFYLSMENSTSNRDVKIFVQGSYANNTNVKKHSDVDIAVVLESTFKPKYRPDAIVSKYGFVDSVDNLSIFKNDIQNALYQKFGNDVERGDKSIHIKENTYRNSIDVVPCMRYKNYEKDYEYNIDNFEKGITIYTDSGNSIINYPEQHIENGILKNRNTSRRYKRMVRILKRVRYDMENNNCQSANNVSSFGLESLLWNVPDRLFINSEPYHHVFNDIITYLFSNVDEIISFKEANGIKDLIPDKLTLKNYKDFIIELYLHYTI